MIKTVAATFECDVCRELALSAGDGGFAIPEGWISVVIDATMRVPAAPLRGAHLKGHVCSTACLAKLFETKIIAILNNDIPKASNAEKST